MEDYLLTVSETASRLKTNKNYTYKLIDSKLLKSIKIGSIKVRNEEINRFLIENDGKDIDVLLKSASSQ